MKKKKIIHIEDDLFFAKTFQKELEKYGYENNNIGHYADCAAALKDEKIDSPDMIFIDHLLENELGALQIPKFKQRFKSAQIILLTSVKDLSLMELAFSNGVDKYLLKNEDLKFQLKNLFA